MPVVITQEEKALPYAKYFYQDLAPIPQEKLDIWHGPMADPALATPVNAANDFLEEGKVALEVGFTVAPNGTGFVANSTFMPGVTPEMFLWWFAWHCVGPDLRYKIWDRDDHLQARAIQADYVRDPAVPWAEKTWGSPTTSWRTSAWAWSGCCSSSASPPTWAMTCPRSAPPPARPWCAPWARAAPPPS